MEKLRDLTTSVLGWGRGRQSDVREASFKQHFKFDDVGTNHAGTIQNPAIHLEMADTILVDQLSKILQRLRLSGLCELLFLLLRHRLYEFSEVPTRLCIEFLGVELNMHIEINPFRLRVGSEPASNEMDF